MKIGLFVGCPEGNAFAEYSSGSLIFGTITAFALLLSLYIMVKFITDRNMAHSKLYLFLSILFVTITLILNIWLWNSNPYGYY